MNKTMKKKLELDENTAKQLYPTAAPEFKKLLEENFGPWFFVTDLTQIVTSVKAACELTGVDYDELMVECGALPDSEAGFKKLKVVAKALRGTFIPDYKNRNQKKWFARHYFDENGRFVSGVAYYCFFYVLSGVPALALPDEKTALFAGQQFIAEYEEYNTCD
jgi:hypothetical protein